MLLTATSIESAYARNSPKMGARKKQVSIVGCGNWGSAVAVIVGNNVRRFPETFDQTVRMYTRREMVDVPGQGGQRALHEVINATHENVKYLPKIPLPASVVAVEGLGASVRDADVLIWVVPHQFVGSMTAEVKANMGLNAISVSLIKGGVDIRDGSIELCSDLLRQQLGHDVSVLMGANVANEVAQGQFCEATIGYTPGSEANAALLQTLFHCPTFSVNTTPDVPGVELCGALKNIVALGAGFVDGLELGGNTKAAVMRVGLGEMQGFVKHFYPSSRSDTFFESCGVADLITTCFGGRNRKCAEAYARSPLFVKGKALWEEIEQNLLNGQKLQGTLTCEEIVAVIRKNKAEAKFPFFMAIHAIAFENKPCDQLFSLMMNERAAASNGK